MEIFDFLQISSLSLSHTHSATRIACNIFNPMVILYVILIVLTKWSFSDLSIYPLLKRSLSGAMEALTFSIVDSAVSTHKFVDDSVYIQKKRHHIRLTHIFFYFYISSSKTSISDLWKLAVSPSRSNFLSNMDRILWCFEHTKPCIGPSTREAKAQTQAQLIFKKSIFVHKNP